jgi:hypothetical protein
MEISDPYPLHALHALHRLHSAAHHAKVLLLPLYQRPPLMVARSRVYSTILYISLLPAYQSAVDFACH